VEEGTVNVADAGMGATLGSVAGGVAGLGGGYCVMGKMNTGECCLWYLKIVASWVSWWC
jgi:hypothetical protein